MILVTGARGTVGSELVRQLQAKRTEFRVASREPSRAPKGLEAVVFDLDRPDTLPAALEGIDTVFLLSNVVTSELNAVKAARAAGVKRIVKLSAWGAGEEAFSFARWHRQVERAIEASGLRWTHLRPNGFMQNVVNYTGTTIRRDGALYLPAGEARISHVDVRDIAAVAATVLTGDGHDRKAYEISGPAALSYADIAAVLSRVLGREIRYVNVTPEQYKQAVTSAGMPESYADGLNDLYRYYREGHAARMTPVVREVIGRNPIPFEQFARDHASALQPQEVRA